jgi:uncharacterized protein (DUF2141 family)
MTKRMLMLVVTALAPGVTGAAYGAGGEIRAEVTGARSASGEVRCALYTSAAGFPRQPAFKAEAPIQDGKAVCVFAGRPAGTYAVAVFHDENGNKKLDTNLVGMPKEGVGFSNGARPHLGPPAFEAAQFSHDGGATQVSIKLVY